MDKLLEILKDIRPDVDFENEKNLIGDSILDSLDVMSIVSEICDAFDIQVSPADIVPANFNSAEAMYKMIERLK